MIMFTKPYQVIRRTGSGSYVKGEWVPAVASSAVTLNLNVQPAGANDDDDLICYAEAGSLNPRDEGDRHEGDIVIVHGQRYVVTTVDRWDSFGGAETAHDRYSLKQEIPKGPGEP